MVRMTRRRGGAAAAPPLSQRPCPHPYAVRSGRACIAYDGPSAIARLSEQQRTTAWKAHTQKHFEGRAVPRSSPAVVEGVACAKGYAMHPRPGARCVAYNGPRAVSEASLAARDYAWWLHKQWRKAEFAATSSTMNGSRSRSSSSSRTQRAPSRRSSRSSSHRAPSRGASPVDVPPPPAASTSSRRSSSHRAPSRGVSPVPPPPAASTSSHRISSGAPLLLHLHAPPVAHVPSQASGNSRRSSSSHRAAPAPQHVSPRQASSAPSPISMSSLGVSVPSVSSHASTVRAVMPQPTLGSHPGAKHVSRASSVRSQVMGLAPPAAAATAAAIPAAAASSSHKTTAASGSARATPQLAAASSSSSSSSSSTARQPLAPLQPRHGMGKDLAFSNPAIVKKLQNAATQDFLKRGYTRA